MAVSYNYFNLKMKLQTLIFIVGTVALVSAGDIDEDSAPVFAQGPIDEDSAPVFAQVKAPIDEDSAPVFA
jgi:hypothetical protein